MRPVVSVLFTCSTPRLGLISFTMLPGQVDEQQCMKLENTARVSTEMRVAMDWSVNLHRKHRMRSVEGLRYF